MKSFQPLTNQQLPTFLRKNEDEDNLIKQVTLNNVNGSTLIENHDMAKSVTLDVSHLPTGIYIINIVIDDKLYSKKIIKAM